MWIIDPSRFRQHDMSWALYISPLFRAICIFFLFFAVLVYTPNSMLSTPDRYFLLLIIPRVRYVTFGTVHKNRTREQNSMFASLARCSSAPSITLSFSFESSRCIKSTPDDDPDNELEQPVAIHIYIILLLAIAIHKARSAHNTSSIRKTKCEMEWNGI